MRTHVKRTKLFAQDLIRLQSERHHHLKYKDFCPHHPHPPTVPKFAMCGASIFFALRAMRKSSAYVCPSNQKKSFRAQLYLHTGLLTTAIGCFCCCCCCRLTACRWRAFFFCALHTTSFIRILPSDTLGKYPSRPHITQKRRLGCTWSDVRPIGEIDSIDVDVCAPRVSLWRRCRMMCMGNINGSVVGWQRFQGLICLHFRMWTKLAASSFIGTNPRTCAHANCARTHYVYADWSRLRSGAGLP